jgi:hypothetical protein
LNPAREFIEGLVRLHIECCEEHYLDGVLVGYLLLFNFYGRRSFHAYKLVDGYGVRAFRLAKDFIQKHNATSLETTEDKVDVVRVAKMLGFVEDQQVDNLLAFRRAA